MSDTRQQRAYSPTFRDRFQCRVEIGQDSDCWLWTGFTWRGYGQISVGRATEGRLGVHIAAWEMASGERLPKGRLVGHTCDVRRCVRNDGEEGTYEVNGVLYRRFGHLWLGTIAANIADMVAKGRQASGDRATARRYPERVARGERHGSHLHPESVLRGEQIKQARLRETDVRAIRARIAGGDSQRLIAADYGVSRATIGLIATGRNWAWLT